MTARLTLWHAARVYRDAAREGVGVAEIVRRALAAWYAYDHNRRDPLTPEDLQRAKAPTLPNRRQTREERLELAKRRAAKLAKPARASAKKIPADKT